jgi:hypothetical protein
MEIKRIFDRNYSAVLANESAKGCPIDTGTVIDKAQELTVKYVESVNRLSGNGIIDLRVTPLSHDPFHGRTWIVEKFCGLGNSPWDPR